MGVTPGIGHNGGPVDDAGLSWRRHAWGVARARLLPHLPVEVVRLRVARAAELGLDYRTYAGVRASTGRDVIGFLFSTNALGLIRPGAVPPAPVVARLAAVRGADRTALVRPPLAAAAVRAAVPVDATAPAPLFTDPWAVMRDRIRAAIRARGLPPDGVILVGETEEERAWAEAGRTAAFLSGARYVAATPPVAPPAAP